MNKHTYLTIILSFFILSAFGQTTEQLAKDACDKCHKCLETIDLDSLQNVIPRSCLISCVTCSKESPSDLPKEIIDILSQAPKETTHCDTTCMKDILKYMNIIVDDDNPCSLFLCVGNEQLITPGFFYLPERNFEINRPKIEAIVNGDSQRIIFSKPKKFRLEEILPPKLLQNYHENIKALGFSAGTTLYRIDYQPKGNIKSTDINKIKINNRRIFRRIQDQKIIFNHR